MLSLIKKGVGVASSGVDFIRQQGVGHNLTFILKEIRAIKVRLKNMIWEASKSPTMKNELPLTNRAKCIKILI